MESSKDEYQEVVRNIPSDVLIVDEAGEVLHATPSIQRITGYTPEDRIGGQVFEHVHPDDQQQVRETFSDILNSDDDELVTAEFRYRHKGGSWIWLEARANGRHARLR